MTEVLLVIAPATFRDEEYAEPKAVLETRGAAVTTASSVVGPCVGKLGMVAESEMDLVTAIGRPWDAVVFVGGAGAVVFFDDADAHELARETTRRGAVLSAICVAPTILARAGVLGGKSATAFATQREELETVGAIWSADSVTLDGQLVTANGPEAATAFGHAIADALVLRP